MRYFYNKFYFLKWTAFIIIYSLHGNVLAQDVTTLSEKIRVADALLDKKQYSNAYELYHEVYKTDKYYSNQMLLKMAMIKEMEDDISQTLFYLNEYYYKTKDKETRQYMQQIGKDRNIDGYKIDDSEYISYFVNIYRAELQITFCVLLLLALAFITYKQLIHNEISVISIFTLLTFAIILFYLSESNEENYYLIIKNDKARIINKPSAGGNLLEKTRVGSRYRILSKEDVWWKVAYNDERAGYIREQYVLVTSNLK